MPRMRCDCGKVLSAPDEWAGKSVRCPGCAATLVVPESSTARNAAVTPQRPAQPVVVKAVPRRQEERDDDDFRAHRPRKRAQQNSNIWMWLLAGGGVLGLLFLVCGGGVAAWFFLGRDNATTKPGPVVVDNPKPNNNVNNPNPNNVNNPQPGVIEDPILGKPFLDEKKTVPSGLEWNREITSPKGGLMTFRVTSQGPFAITVVTEKGYKAVVGGGKKGFTKKDLLLAVDSKNLTYQGQVKLPPGSSYFIIENQANKPVEFHLQCFDVKMAAPPEKKPIEKKTPETKKTPNFPNIPDLKATENALQLLAVGKFVEPKAGDAPVTYIYAKSPAGDYIGAGKTYRYSAEQIKVGRELKSVLIQVDGWRINFSGPKSQPIEVGEYPNAKRHPFNGDSPGLDWSGQGRGSNKLSGGFVVWELEVDGKQVSRLAIDLFQRSEEKGPPLCAVIRYNSKFQ
jgi:hypothetical protein